MTNHTKAYVVQEYLEHRRTGQTHEEAIAEVLREYNYDATLEHERITRDEVETILEEWERYDQAKADKELEQISILAGILGILLIALIIAGSVLAVWLAISPHRRN